jgi:hypothetical protein
MSQFNDPNREAVGLSPIWTGAGEEPEATKSSAGEKFDPGEHTVADVEAYIAEHPDEADAVRKAEAKGKNRSSLTGGGG